MVKHIVMWRLKEQAEGADQATNARLVKAALEGLRGRIPGLLAIEVGINIDRSSAAFDVVLYSEFESAQALAAYQVHPDHENAAALIGRVRTERVLVDYQAD